MACDARLKINHLQVVKNDLWDARTKWKDFGLALWVRKSTLDAIDITQRGDPGDCMREMLSEWLRGAGDPPRTWGTIVAALAKVDSQGALAVEIARKYNIAYEPTTKANSAQATPEYQTITECTSSLITAIQNHLIDLSSQLLQRHLITSNQQGEMNNEMHSKPSRAATLLEFIRDKVEQNPKCYHSFIEALEEDQSTNQDILVQLKTKYNSLSGESQTKTAVTAPRSQVQAEAASATSQHKSTTGQLLSIDDLDAVLEEVWDAKEKWFYIGLKLGTKLDKLNVIEHDKKNDDDRFTAVIVDWLSRGEANCTWTTLAEALRSRTVGFGPLADQLPKS